MVIRPESPHDFAEVYNVVEAAFGQRDEADLVDSLRETADPTISLVAEMGGRVVGHIFFSPVSIEGSSDAVTAMGLAPMAVLPEFQNRGIGSALVREGLNECRRIGVDVVVVLGHPKYYPRFGFIPASRKGLRSEYDVPDDTFMALELRPGALSGAAGLVKYHRAFSRDVRTLER